MAIYVSKQEVDAALHATPKQGKHMLPPFVDLQKATGIPFGILEDTNVDNEPEVHVHEDDLWLCIEGPVTFVCGGELVEPYTKVGSDGKPKNLNELKGKSIRGGIEYVLQAGEWLWIPAGEPHLHKKLNGTARLAIIKIPKKPYPKTSGEVLGKLKKVRLLVLDFDGVFTDGTVIVQQDGTESIVRSRVDSTGFTMLQRAGVGIVVLSREQNPVVAATCSKTKIPSFQGLEKTADKLDILKQLTNDLDFLNNKDGLLRVNLQLDRPLNSEEIAYMGDDVNDLAALRYAGVKLAPANARPQVKALADYVTEAKGGTEHAIREVIELILTAQEKQIVL